MKISHFGGAVDCQTIDDLENILKIRYGEDVNEYWLSGDEPYPCLAILVNNGRANVHYFPADGHPGFQSVGNDHGNGGTSVFYVNTPYEEIEVVNSSIVNFSAALKAAKEFFDTMCMPRCIEWFEL